MLAFIVLLKFHIPVSVGLLNIYRKEVTLSNMADVQRLNISRRIHRPKKKSNVMNDKLIRDSTARYSAGGYSAVEFLSSVCHCCESVTDVLNQDNDGSSTEEYELSDEENNGHNSIEVTAAATVTQAATTSVASTCDVCLVEARENIAIVPCGHATFSKQCVDTLVAGNGHCPICRGPINTTMQFYS